MSNVRRELAEYGVKIARAGLVAGAGGNISARDGSIIWMKPSGFAMDELKPSDFCGLDLKSGRQIKGHSKPTSEYEMHLGIYRVRPDVAAVFHTHSPWASGVFSSGVKLGPMFAEFVCDLGRVTTVPYVTPTTMRLAAAVAEAAKKNDTIFLNNHGVVALGVLLKEAFYRCAVVEDAAKSMVAAAAVGRPRFLTGAEIRDLKAQGAFWHRRKMMGKK